MTHPSRKNRDLRRTPWLTNGDGRGLDAKTEEILDRAYAHVQSVDYRVDLRWVFYRLYQEGFYQVKGDYKNKFNHLISKARHTCFKEWRPDTLTDDTREIIVRAGGYPDTESAEEDLKSRLINVARIQVDHFHRQDYYIQIWFEARGMAGQFKKYTRCIDLAPMGGMASVPFKFALAESITEAAAIYNKPVKILYFGDEDEAGHKIARISKKDVARWTKVPFEVIWCGLTPQQIERYRIPRHPDKKGYQWVALEDPAAGEIITSTVAQHIDMNLVDEADEEAEEFAETWREKLENILKKMK